MNLLKAVYRMEHACRINSFIYALRYLPFIKRLVSENWYGRRQVKDVLGIITFVGNLVWLFLRKMLYVGGMIYLPAMLLPGELKANFIHIFFLLTLTGAYANDEMLETSKKKYYAVNVMMADARTYALYSYFENLAEVLAGMLPAFLVFGSMAGFSLWLCLLFPAAMVFEKLCGTAVYVWVYEKTGKLNHVDYPIRFLLVLLLILAICYGLLWKGICIPFQVQVLAGTLAVPGAAFSVRYLWDHKMYNSFYRRRMKLESVVFNTEEAIIRTRKEEMEKKLDTGEVYSEKNGYEYFNEIFVKRHRKILLRPIKQVAVGAGVLLAILSAIALFHEGFRAGVNWILLNYLPYMVFIMYLLNRGENISKAMFFNCDHSMLTYRFYRQPEAILCLFKIRLKTLIFMNLIPGSVIAAGLLLLYIASGGGDILNYFLIPCSILALSVFFSVHYLVLYYLFQPYNVQMETKTHTYGIAMSLTYVFCYLFIRLQISTLTFAALLIIFCALYIGAALRLVYKRASKTFRLK